MGSSINQVGQANRLSYLDSLRGFAVIAVVTSHFLERTPVHESWFMSHINLGQFGVVIFFILSGMVIPYSFHGAEKPIVKFAISRFFRLYPVYWVSVIFAVLSAVVFYSTLPDLKNMVINLTMVQAVFGVPDLFGVYWTLLIELMFYFCCAVLFSFKKLHNIRTVFLVSTIFLLLAVLLAFVRWQLDKKLPVAIPLSLSLMFFGSLWREASVSCSKPAVKYCVIWVALFSLMLPVICFLAYSKSYGFGENPIAYGVTYYMGLGLFLLLTSAVKIVFRPLVFLGIISYSVYLFHQFFLEFSSKYLDIGSGFSWVKFALYIAMVVSFSTASYFLVERPSNRIGKKISKGRDLSFEKITPMQKIL